MLLLSVNCKFYGNVTCMQIPTPFLKMMTNRGGQMWRDATNGPNFNLSYIWMHIIWKHFLLHLNKEQNLFQVMEQADFSECEINF